MNESPQAILAKVATSCGVSKGDILGKSRLRRHCDARAIFAYLANRDAGLIYADLDRLLKRSHPSSRWMIARVRASQEVEPRLWERVEAIGRVAACPYCGNVC